MIHLYRARPGGQRQQLMAQTDAEHRGVGIEDLGDRLDRVVAGLGVARAVGQEHAVGLHRQHFGGRGLRRHHGQPAAARGEQAQDVVLAAVVVGDHVEGPLSGGGIGVALAQRPVALAPFVTLGAADFLGQVHALEAGELARRCQRTLGGIVAFGIGSGENRPVLRALVAQDARQPARVDIGDGQHVLALEVVVQGPLAAKIAGHQWQIANHQSRRTDARGFDILVIDAGVADMRIGERDDLPGIGGVGKDFLIAGHGRIENHLAAGLSIGADGAAMKYAAICQGQYRGSSQRNVLQCSLRKTARRAASNVSPRIRKHMLTDAQVVKKRDETRRRPVPSRLLLSAFSHRRPCQSPDCHAGQVLGPLLPLPSKPQPGQIDEILPETTHRGQPCERQAPLHRPQLSPSTSCMS